LLGQHGEIAARLLAGSWRPQPSPPSVSASELAEVVPLLLSSGAGALAWWRIRGSPLAESAAAAELRHAYRLHALRAAIHDREISETFGRLRARGVDAVLVKGWAAARLYPHPGLRPYGDIDLLVRPEDSAAARAALADAVIAARPDIHEGGGWLSERPWPEILRRSCALPLGDTEVRVAGAEDHLRYLCLHFLGHGAWRPLWLCDIAAALERGPGALDWGYLLDGDRRRVEWTAQAIALAAQLLGAEHSGPGSVAAPAVPPWLLRCVLREWGRRQVPHGTRTPMASVLRTPKHLLRSLWQRWPNPVEATVGVGGPFNGWPRAPFQVAECAARTARWVIELRRQ
jgi:hypothetical protein